jgi:hypothetical protein
MRLLLSAARFTSIDDSDAKIGVRFRVFDRGAHLCQEDLGGFVGPLLQSAQTHDQEKGKTYTPNNGQ